ncbi:MAG: DegT/DnrJ/EryC1/StrS family aminotransferase [Anaerolineae bacterium]|nr:DegT/DnrJ/EryC1/StrS family aminotransferase [Anaerolineae bacterium]
MRLGYNYRMDELSAALGVAQMERVDELLARRAQVAAWYTERLAQVAGVQAPRITPDVTRMSWFVYVVRLALNLDRNTIMHKLAERGIPTRPYFTPLHLQPLYRKRFGFREGDFPITERVGRSTLALSFSGRMTEEQVEQVCETLGEVVKTF